MTIRHALTTTLLALLLGGSGTGAAEPAPAPVRARDLGIPFSGTPGPLNAITDVAGVEVGYTTLVRGTGAWKRGEGPVRTGVTVVLPRGKAAGSYNAGYFVFNGDGEMTGLPYVYDYGRANGAIGITNTNSVGVVRDAIGAWQYGRFGGGSALSFAFGLPIVAETWDGLLNDINGYHVTREHVFAALDGAAAGRIAEGNVGGGTGMVCFYFKCGTGTASRRLAIGGREYTVGVLVQANFGTREELVIAGVPVGREIADLQPIEHPEQDGSIVIVIGTDAPLSPGQLTLVAKRAALGMARTGTWGNSGSGDLFLAFSTVRSDYDAATAIVTSTALAKPILSAIFRATVEATEEAIVNSLVAARDMDGLDGNRVFALPPDRLRAAMRKYNRLERAE